MKIKSADDQKMRPPSIPSKTKGQRLPKITARDAGAALACR